MQDALSQISPACTPGFRRSGVGLINLLKGWTVYWTTQIQSEIFNLQFSITTNKEVQVIYCLNNLKNAPCLVSDVRKNNKLIQY
jgi:hypothetical protein